MFDHARSDTHYLLYIFNHLRNELVDIRPLNLTLSIMLLRDTRTSSSNVMNTLSTMHLPAKDPVVGMITRHVGLPFPSKNSLLSSKQCVSSAMKSLERKMRAFNAFSP